MKVQSLGTVTSAAAGIVPSGGTNAAPIVVTVGANNRLVTGNRVAIQGTTGLTAMNGIWSITKASATTFSLDGSAGNGTYGGSPTLAVVCDKTPFMRGHSAVAVITQVPGSAVFVGTALVEGSNQTDDAWQSSPSYSDANVGSTGDIAMPAATAGAQYLVEVTMYRYMRFRCSAYTSGGAQCVLIA